MRGKIIWLVVSCLMALSLVLASCAPAAAPEEEVVAPEEEAAAPEEEAAAPEEEVVVEEVAPAVEKPRYGGVLNVGQSSDQQGFDQIYVGIGWGMSTVGQYMANETLAIGDWTLGPAGTNVTDFTMTQWMPDGVFRMIGEAVESFEIPDNQTIIFKVRKGVYWHNKPPVNGRQMTADDIVFSLKYMYLNEEMPRTYNVISAATGAAVTDVYIDPDDSWTVIVKLEGGAWSTFEPMSAKGVHIVAREVIEEYGDYKDWKNSVGTGAWELIDYVPASSITFKRFDNYWQKNPIGPGEGDQLPYMDGVKFLVIGDRSTRMSAMRTGKIDWDQTNLPYEDFQTMRRTSPELLWVKRLASSMPHGLGVTWTNTDPVNEWWFDQRVRWALMMAIDHESILNDYYYGQAQRLAWFFTEGSPYHTTLDQKMEILETKFDIPPEESIYVKKMYGYYPDEAKQLLAEAGYPDGFSTSVIIRATNADFYTIVQGYWADIGVELELDIKATAVWRTYVNEHNPPEMIFAYACPGS